MPKNRKRVIQKGAKSESIVTKHKIGGRKSNVGVNALSLSEMERLVETCRPRDRFKLERGIRGRIRLQVLAAQPRHR